jgi:hypothetical protein
VQAATVGLADASSAEAIAPDSLSGWSTLQRAVNVTLALRLNELDRVLGHVDATLAGFGA